MKMKTRITTKDLESRVAFLNKITGSPATPYTKLAKPGKYEPNVGNYHLDWAYGGVKVIRMMENGGCSNPFSVGFETKRECLGVLNSFIKGVEAGKEIAS